MDTIFFKITVFIFRSQRYFDKLSINYNTQQMTAKSDINII